MNKKTIVITGATGFVGKNLSTYFLKKSWNVVKINLRKWNASKFIKHKPDLVVQCAGGSSVSESFTNPKADFDANVSALLPVLEAMRQGKLKTKLIYLSSVAVYGEKKGAIKENSSLSPVSPYGFHKKIAEELCESYSKNYGLKISIIRFFSIYGPGLKKQIFWDACNKIKDGSGKLTFFGTGREVRDFLYIGDALELIYIVSKTKNNFEIFNGGSGQKIKIQKVVKMLTKEFGKKVEVVFDGSTRSGDPKSYLADISKVKKLGFKTDTNLEEGLYNYVQFFKSLK